MPQRTITLDGCLNFRDLGGYPVAGGGHVRWRRLFRSDSLHRLTTSDGVRLRELGVVQAIDLRTTAEREDALPDDECVAGIHVRHVPMIDSVLHRTEGAEEPPNEWRAGADFDMGEAYAGMLARAEPRIADILCQLAEPGGLPAVFYCAAGKDRTGVLSALVLAVLGVSDDDIVADYARTGDVIESILARNTQERPSLRQVFSELPPEARLAPAPAMRSFLAAAGRRWGSLHDFAASLPGADTFVPALRAELVE